jgi:hypothetical protein
MGLKNLELLKPANKSKVVANSAIILEYLERNFGKVQDKPSLKHLPSFILYVCCCVEETYSNKKNIENTKVNKKDEVLKLICEFIKVQLNEQDKKLISDIIEDLHSSRRIKKVSYLSKSLFWLSKFFLKHE